MDLIILYRVRKTCINNERSLSPYLYMGRFKNWLQ